MYASCSCFTVFFWRWAYRAHISLLNNKPIPVVRHSSCLCLGTHWWGNKLQEQFKTCRCPSASQSLVPSQVLLWGQCLVLHHPAVGPTLALTGEPEPLAMSLKHLLFTNDLAATSFPLDPAKSHNSPWQLILSQ